jgi:hypothetical protein
MISPQQTLLQREGTENIYTQIYGIRFFRYCPQPFHIPTSQLDGVSPAVWLGHGVSTPHVL